MVCRWGECLRETYCRECLEGENFLRRVSEWIMSVESVWGLCLSTERGRHVRGQWYLRRISERSCLIRMYEGDVLEKRDYICGKCLRGHFWGECQMVPYQQRISEVNVSVECLGVIFWGECLRETYLRWVRGTCWGECLRQHIWGVCLKGTWLREYVEESVWGVMCLRRVTKGFMSEEDDWVGTCLRRVKTCMRSVWGSMPEGNVWGGHIWEEYWNEACLSIWSLGNMFDIVSEGNMSEKSVWGNLIWGV